MRKALENPYMIDSIIFDWKRTLYDPDTKTLIDGTKEILNKIQEIGIPMTLVGKGGQDMYSETKRLNVEKYFKNIIFNESPKEKELFEPYISKNNPRATLFIGDRIRSELAAGKSLGTTTLWVRQGKFATEEPENAAQNPDYTVNSLLEANSLLDELLKKI